MRDNKLLSPEHAAILIGKQRSLNRDLLENARKGLDSIYKLNKTNGEIENNGTFVKLFSLQSNFRLFSIQLKFFKNNKDTCLLNAPVI